MIIAVLRWLTCVAISAEMVIWSISGAHSIYALIFGVVCVGALVYEHGWKIDRKKGHTAEYLGFYLIPFVVVGLRDFVWGAPGDRQGVGGASPLR